MGRGKFKLSFQNRKQRVILTFLAKSISYVSNSNSLEWINYIRVWSFNNSGYQVILVQVRMTNAFVLEIINQSFVGAPSYIIQASSTLTKSSLANVTSSLFVFCNSRIKFGFDSRMTLIICRIKNISKLWIFFMTVLIENNKPNKDNNYLVLNLHFLRTNMLACLREANLTWDTPLIVLMSLSIFLSLVFLLKLVFCSFAYLPV